MNDDELKKSIIDLLKAQELCVIATVSPNREAEAALVAFSANEKLEITIGTSKESRKYKNIQRNPKVAIVFGPIEKRAIQYEGNARELQDVELAQRKKEHLKKHPGATKYDDDPTQTYLLIEPTWIRLVESGPSFVGELRQFS